MTGKYFEHVQNNLRRVYDGFLSYEKNRIMIVTIVSRLFWILSALHIDITDELQPDTFQQLLKKLAPDEHSFLLSLLGLS